MNQMKVFKGVHNFCKYCTKNLIFTQQIMYSRIPCSEMQVEIGKLLPIF